MWVECNVQRNGSTPNTYTIFVSIAPATHQTWDGVHASRLRKAGKVPTYEVGELAEVMSSKGPEAGHGPPWMRCAISGKGREPNTYRIRVPARGGALDIEDVPTKVLRKVKQQPVAFEVGEKIEIQIGKGPSKGMWVEGNITGQGEQPGTYNVRMLTLKSPGYLDVSTVSAEGLRKAKSVRTEL